MFSLLLHSTRQDIYNRRIPRNEHALIAHFEREAIAQWRELPSSSSSSSSAGSTSSNSSNNHIKSKPRYPRKLTETERGALKKARNVPYSRDDGWLPALCTLLCLRGGRRVFYNFRSKDVLYQASSKNQSHHAAAKNKTSATMDAATTTYKYLFTTISPNQKTWMLDLFLANEVRVWVQQSNRAQAASWKEMATWPFANTKLEPLPLLASATCPPMLEAMAMLPATIDDKQEGSSNNNDGKKNANNVNNKMTASLLNKSRKAKSYELRGMLDFAMQCEQHYNGPRPGVKQQRPVPFLTTRLGNLWGCPQVARKKAMDRPRKTLREWLGE